MSAEESIPTRHGDGSPWTKAMLIAAGPLVALAVYLALGGIDSLPEAGRRTAAVLVWMGVWWLTEALPLAATSLLPLVLFPVLGVKTPREAAAPYADSVVFLFLCGFLLAIAMERWNLHRRIALHTVLLVGIRPVPLIGGFMGATAFLSMWMSNTAATMMMLPIASSIIALVEQQAPRSARNFSIALLLGVAYAASIGGVATPIGSPPNAILISFVARTYDIRIGFLQWCLIAVPFVLVFLPIVWLYLTKLALKVKDFDLPGASSIIRDELRAMGPLSRGERSTAAVFVFAVSGWLLREPVAALFPGVGAWIKSSIDDTSVAVAAAVLLFAIPVDLKNRIFVLDARAFTKLPWDVLLLFGGGLSLASAVQSSGLSTFLGEQLSLLGGWPPLLMMVVLLAVAVFASEVTSNTAQANLFLPILAGVAAATGIAPLSLLIPVGVALSCAFMMPMGTPPNALVFASGRLTMAQMARTGFALDLTTITLCTVLAYTLVPLLIAQLTPTSP